ncbi:phosphotransferase family protein [Exiguobacterium profundum]|uniref:phosphotransferase family protein n=1 Tax=Exiguobacterium TaxID=33986 RepID=UPI0018C401E9|nr:MULTISPECIES: aminoglycoside phosphotransferase family protein [Exiguobacterium]MBG0918292.1 aminoglycoside phosphotransferase family protein [Exiguobacterium sp. SRB7LM]MCT4798498.1 aminoglycoside phosphotransferase family protein [Exiguobacterium profundum]QPI67883.1 aminoglycoside phosphotransferase family protein [Exiguobacterium sp. PBE]
MEQLSVFWENTDLKHEFDQWIDEYISNETWHLEKDTDLTYLVHGNGVYAKAVTSISQSEGMLSQYLAHMLPGLVPDVVAVHPVHPWFILRKVSGHPLRDVPDQEQYEVALREYAKLQQRMSGETEQLLKMGVPDRRPSMLREEIESTFVEMSLNLERVQREEVLALKPELLSMCEELESGIPMSLDHGDLHGGNIFWEPESNQPVILDWGDATITHPFFSMRVFWNILFDLLPEEDDTLWIEKIHELRKVYLKEWRHVAPTEILERHMKIAEELGCVYRAISWHTYVTAHRRDKKDSSDKPAQWLKLLLEYRKLQRDTH